MYTAFRTQGKKAKIPRLLDIFEGLELPPASSDKKIFLMLIHKNDDGVGDFEHGWDIANHIKDELNKKGYELVAFVHSTKREFTPTGDLEKDISKEQKHKRAEHIERKLKQQGNPFDRYYLFQDDGFDADIEHLNSIIENVAGSLEISYPYDVLGNLMKERNIANIFIKEYSMQYRDQSFWNAPMAIDSNQCESYGLKVYPENKISPINVFEALYKSVPDFVHYLLNIDHSPTKEEVDQYLDSHVICPAYLQTRIAAISFILTLCNKYKEENKVIDILLPSNVVDRKMILRVMKAAGIEAEQVAFFKEGDKLDSNYNRHAKFRVISHRIPLDSDYQNLYHLSEGVAGCSGDNSISQVLSSANMIFFEYKAGIIGGVYQSFIKMAKALKEQNNNPELKNGFDKLEQYFKLLRKMIRSFQHWAESFEIESLIMHGMEKEYISKLESTVFQGYCEDLAALLNDPDLNMAWMHMRSEIQKNNFYDKLPVLLTASILMTQYQGDELVGKVASNTSFDRVIEQIISTNIQSLSEVCKNTEDQFILVNLLEEFMKRHPDFENSNRVDQLIRSYEPPAPEENRGRLGI